MLEVVVGAIIMFVGIVLGFSLAVAIANGRRDEDG